MTLALRSIERRQPLLDVLLPRTRVCRLLNVTVAAIGLVVTLPLMLVIAVAIRMTSGSPIIFTQTRIGIDRRARKRRFNGSGRRSDDLGGRPFTIYKFRTMTPRMGSSAAQMWARPADRRVGARHTRTAACSTATFPHTTNAGQATHRGSRRSVGQRHPITASRQMTPAAASAIPAIWPPVDTVRTSSERIPTIPAAGSNQRQ